MRKRRYCVWKEREERLCRACEKEEEGWKHVPERERGREGDEKWEMENEIHERVIEILAENGSGERWMKEIEREGRER